MMWSSRNPLMNHLDGGRSGELPLMTSDIAELKLSCRNVNSGGRDPAGGCRRHFSIVKRPEINLLNRDANCASSSSDRIVHRRKALAGKFSGVSVGDFVDADATRPTGLLNWRPAKNHAAHGAMKAVGGIGMAADGAPADCVGSNAALHHRYYRLQHRQHLPESSTERNGYGSRQKLQQRAGIGQSRLPDEATKESSFCRTQLLQRSLHTLLEEDDTENEGEQRCPKPLPILQTQGFMNAASGDDCCRVQRPTSDRPPSGGLWEALLQYQAESLEQKQSRSSSIASSELEASSSSSPPYPQVKIPAAAEPLPLLTEIEDFNDSEDMAVSSLDGGDYHAPPQMKAPPERRGEAADGDAQPPPEDGDRRLRPCIGSVPPRNLSQKYRPKAFEEMVGQSIVVKALATAVRRRKIAPVYLFHGCRGTGKTTAARIFGAALTCGVGGVDWRRNSNSPCTKCSECEAVATGTSDKVKEVDAASNNGVEKVRMLLEETLSESPAAPPPPPLYRVLIIDECHVLTPETWNALLKILEEPPNHVVFILITTDPDRLPLTAISRCQRFPFMKIRVPDIVKRLRRLSAFERLDVGVDVLRLIAAQSDGSLRDAETTLDQLSLFAGRHLSSSTVQELVGMAPDGSMLSLLNSSLTGDVVGTVQRVRKLVDSGMEPLSVMSRLASLIADIIAGGSRLPETPGSFCYGWNLSGEHLKRLCMAMRTLSEAEKQLRESGNDRTTWLTAALLQLAPPRPTYALLSSSVDGKSGDDIEDDDASFAAVVRSSDQTTTAVLKPDKLPHPNLPLQTHGISCNFDDGNLSSVNATSNKSTNLLTAEKLDEIWCRTVDRCRPYSVRQLLRTHGRLASISMSDVDAVIYVEVNDPQQKPMFERWQKMIALALEALLCFPVAVKIGVAAASGGVPAAGDEGRGAAIQSNRRTENISSFAGSDGNDRTSPVRQNLTLGGLRTVPETIVDDGRNMNRIDGNGSRIPDCSTGERNGREKTDGSAICSDEESETQCMDDRRRKATTERGAAAAADGGGRVKQRPKERSGGGSLTMVRRLTLKSRILALPNSDPSSPNAALAGGGGAEELRRQNNSGDWSGVERKGAAASGEEAVGKEAAAAGSRRSTGRAAQESAVNGESRSTGPGQRRLSILRGAAGSLTRFFKGTK